MPDESCRNCGVMLQEYLKCTKCKKPSQFLCRNCGRVTEHQFHINCNIKNKNQILETLQNNTYVESIA